MFHFSRWKHPKLASALSVSLAALALAAVLTS